MSHLTTIKFTKTSIITLFSVSVVVSWVVVPYYFSDGQIGFQLFVKDFAEAAMVFGPIITIFSALIFAILLTVVVAIAIKLYNTQTTLGKIVGITLASFLLITVIGLFTKPYRDIALKNDKEEDYVSNLGFETYLSNGNGKFNQYSLCDGAGINFFYDLELDYFLSQVQKIQDDSCFELNRNKYEGFYSAGKAGIPYKRAEWDTEHYPVIKQVNQEQVVLIRRTNQNGKLWLESIMGVKGDTLIEVSGSTVDCLAESECEEKYIEFYRSLSEMKPSNSVFDNF